MRSLRIIIMVAILLLIPWRITWALERADTANTTRARFAGGITLDKASPTGALALILPIAPNFCTATSLLSNGNEGGIQSEVFWSVYNSKGFNVALALGASADIIRENPTYEQALLYASATPGFALTYRITNNLSIHASLIYLAPAEPRRHIRAHFLLSFPIRS